MADRPSGGDNSSTLVYTARGTPSPHTHFSAQIFAGNNVFAVIVLEGEDREA